MRQKSHFRWESSRFLFSPLQKGTASSKCPSILNFGMLSWCSSHFWARIPFLKLTRSTPRLQRLSNIFINFLMQLWCVSNLSATARAVTVLSVWDVVPPLQHGSSHFHGSKIHVITFRHYVWYDSFLTYPFQSCKDWTAIVALYLDIKALFMLVAPVLCLVLGKADVSSF